MKSVVACGLAVAVLVAISTSSSAQPLLLNDTQLDFVTSGATSGTRLDIDATAGNSSGSIFAQFTSMSGMFEVDSFSAASGGAFLNGADTAEVNGEVTLSTINTPSTSTTFAIYSLRETTTGDASVDSVEASGLATGDVAVTRSRSFPLPDNRVLYVTFGFAADFL